MKNLGLNIVIVMLAGLVFSGCASTSPNHVSNWTPSQKGTVGAGMGAIGGAIYTAAKGGNSNDYLNNMGAGAVAGVLLPMVFQGIGDFINPQQPAQQAPASGQQAVFDPATGQMVAVNGAAQVSPGVNNQVGEMVYEWDPQRGWVPVSGTLRSQFQGTAPAPLWTPANPTPGNMPAAGAPMSPGGGVQLGPR